MTLEVREFLWVSVISQNFQHIRSDILESRGHASSLNLIGIVLGRM